MELKVSGIDPGQRRLNGPQTTGRTYRKSVATRVRHGGGWWRCRDSFHL